MSLYLIIMYCSCVVYICLSKVVSLVWCLFSYQFLSSSLTLSHTPRDTHKHTNSTYTKPTISLHRIHNSTGNDQWNETVFRTEQKTTTTKKNLPIFFFSIDFPMFWTLCGPMKVKSSGTATVGHKNISAFRNKRRGVGLIENVSFLLSSTIWRHFSF